jgi:hypothetical protein
MLIITTLPGTGITGIGSTSNTIVLSSKGTTGLISSMVDLTTHGLNMTAASTEGGGKR